MKEERLQITNTDVGSDCLAHEIRGCTGTTPGGAVPDNGQEIAEAIATTCDRTIIRTTSFGSRMTLKRAVRMKQGDLAPGGRDSPRGGGRVSRKSVTRTCDGNLQRHDTQASVSSSPLTLVGVGRLTGSPLTLANLMRSSRPLRLTPVCPFFSPFSKTKVSG